MSNKWTEADVLPLFECGNVNELAKKYCDIFGFDESDIKKPQIELSDEEKKFPPNMRLIYLDDDVTPIAVVYDESVDSGVNPSKRYYPRLKNFDKAYGLLSQLTPELYAIVGKRRAIWLRSNRRYGGRFELKIPLRITSVVADKLERLHRENLRYEDDIILGKHLKVDFLFQHSELDREFISLMDQLKLLLVEKIIKNKEVIGLIKDKLKFNEQSYSVLIRKRIFQDMVMAIADTTILRALLERFILVNFDGLDEELEMKINELSTKVRSKKRAPTIEEFFTEESFDIQSDYKNVLREKDELLKKYMGGDFYNSIVSATIGEIQGLLDENISAWIQEAVDSDRYNFRYEDLNIDVIQDFYERSLHKVISIKVVDDSLPSEDWEYKVEIDNSKLAQKQAGAFFTPSELCDKMVKLSLESYLNSEVFNPLTEKLRSLQAGKNRKKIFDSIEDILKRFIGIKICDPAMGAGVFLRSAFHYMSNLFMRIANILNSAHKDYPDKIEKILSKLDVKFLLSEDYDFDKIAKWEEYILKNMLFGVDLDIRAVYISSQVLTLSSLKHLQHGQHFPTFINLNLKQGNSLVFPLDLSDDAARTISERYKSEIEEVMKLRNEIKTTNEYSEIQALIRQANTLLDPIRGELIKENLIIDKRTEGISVFTEAQLEDRRLLPFVWQLEFPEIFFNSDGSVKDKTGFNLVIGNPPWEKWKFYDHEWFGKYNQDVGLSSNNTKDMIKKFLDEHPELQEDYDYNQGIYKTTSLYLKKRFVRRGKGDLNLYKLFMEVFFDLSTNDGLYSFVVQGSVLGDAGGTELRKMMVKYSKVIAFFELIASSSITSSKTFFPHIHTGISILVAIARKEMRTDTIIYRTKLMTVDELNFNDSAILKEINEGRSIATISNKYNVPLLQWKQIVDYSPNYLIIPAINNNRELIVLDKLYTHPLLSGQIWSGKTYSGLHVTNEKKRGTFSEVPTKYPIVEGQHMVRFGYSTISPSRWLKEDRLDRFPLLESDYIGWKDISLNDDRRRMRVAYFKREDRIPITNSVLCITDLPENSYYYITAIMNSIPFEFRIRQICYGQHMLQYIIDQMPVPLFSSDDPVHQYITEKVIEFEETAKLWADEKVLERGNRAEAVGELRYKSQLSEFDALAAIAYGLNLGDFKVTLAAHPKVPVEYKREALDHFHNLIKRFDLDNSYLEDDTDIEYKEE